MFLVLAATALAPTGCGTADADGDWVNQRCRYTADVPAWDRCVVDAIAALPARHAAEEARVNAEWDAVGAAMLSRPVHTSCMNIGGIVTCDSR